MTTTANWEITQLFGVSGFDGKCLRYRGDIWADRVEVKDDHDSPVRQCEGAELIALRIQVLAERYRDREVYACQSGLMDEILRRGDFEYLTYEDIENLRDNPDNWTAAQCREWLSDNGVGHDTWDAIRDNPFKLDRDELVEELTALSIECRDEESTETLAEALFSAIDDGDWGDVDEWRNAVRDNTTEKEIYEWWLVSEWLHNQLKEIGEPVLDNGFNHWWGRTTTGQGILMDGVLQRVAARHIERTS